MTYYIENGVHHLVISDEFVLVVACVTLCITVLIRKLKRKKT